MWLLGSSGSYVTPTIISAGILPQNQLKDYQSKSYPEPSPIALVQYITQG